MADPRFMRSVRDLVPRGQGASKALVLAILAEVDERDALIRSYRADHNLPFDKGHTCPCVLCQEAGELLGGNGGE